MGERHMKVYIVVYHGEVFYFEHLNDLQMRLGRPFDPASYSYHPEHKQLRFNTEAEAEQFWQKMYEKDLGGSHEISVSSNTSVGELTEQLTKVYDGTPPYFRTLAYAHLVQIPTGRRLDPKSTLGKEGVEDGDLLELILVFHSSTSYCLMYVPSSQELFSVIHSASEHPPSLNKHHPSLIRSMAPLAKWERSDNPNAQTPTRIWGAFLYTEEDIELALYVRKHFASINQLTGEIFHIFVIETPPKEWRPAIRWWKTQLSDKLPLFQTWNTMGWLSSKPYDNSQAYEVARKLGVYKDQLPCLVLFDNLDRLDKLIFPITEVSPAFFRRLFACLERSIQPGDTSSDAYARIKTQYESIFKSLKVVTTKEDRVNSAEYNLFGATVLVNNANSMEVIQMADQRDQSTNIYGGQVGTIISNPQQAVSDFQNTFITGSNPENDKINLQLKELLEIILGSNDLPDDDKEQAARAVQAVAKEVKEGKSQENKLTIKGILEKVGDVVSKAADIAGPAIAIITAVMKFLG
jgi:hypothetical protein